MYGHVCRSRSHATLAPESMAHEPLPRLMRTQSSADIAQRHSAMNSPTRYWPHNKPYYWPLTSNLCSIVSNYFYYPLFRSYWPSYRSYLLETNWYNRKYDRYQYLPSDPYYNYSPLRSSYYYWYHYPYFKRWYGNF